jgi:hypothetical protein
MLDAQYFGNAIGRPRDPAPSARAGRSKSGRTLVCELFRGRAGHRQTGVWIVTAIAVATEIGSRESESNQREDHPHEQPQEAAAPGERENKPQSDHGRRPHSRHRTFDGDRFRRQR